MNRDHPAALVIIYKDLQHVLLDLQHYGEVARYASCDSHTQSLANRRAKETAA